jgi:hypothetical protein
LLPSTCGGDSSLQVRSGPERPCPSRSIGRGRAAGQAPGCKSIVPPAANKRTANTSIEKCSFCSVFVAAHLEQNEQMFGVFGVFGARLVTGAACANLRPRSSGNSEEQ